MGRNDQKFGKNRNRFVFPSKQITIINSLMEDKKDRKCFTIERLKGSQLNEWQSIADVFSVHIIFTITTI